MTQQEETGPMPPDIPEYQLHFFIFQNKTEKLKSFLDEEFNNKDTLASSKLEFLFSVHFRGQTPLTLAVSLDRVECVQLLLLYGAKTLYKNELGWSAWHEAISVGNRTVLKMIYKARRLEYAEWVNQKGFQVLQEIANQMQDIKFQMTWSFQSVIPFISSLCPSDSYSVYKKGSRVRIDTTLVGYENLNWIRGNISILFIGDGPDPKLVVLDRDTRKIQQIWPKDFSIDDEAIEEDISVALNTPITAAPEINWSSCKFSRAKSGFFAYKYDRNEMVGEYPTSVWNLDKLDVDIKIRKEHLSANPLPSHVLKQQDLLEMERVKAKEMKISKAQKPKSRFVIANPDISLEELEIEEKIKNYKDGYRNISDTPDEEQEWKEAQQAFTDFTQYRRSLDPPLPPALKYSEYISAALSNTPLHLGRPLDTSDSWSKSIQSTLWMYEPQGHEADIETVPIDLKLLITPLLELLGLGNEHIRSFCYFMEGQESMKKEHNSSVPPGVLVQMDLPIGYGIPLSARIRVHSVEKGLEWTRNLDESFWDLPDPSEGYRACEIITSSLGN